MSSELVDFVLANASVRSFPGSRQAWSGAYRLAPRTLDHYDCIYLVRGQMAWTLGEQHLAVGPSDLLILPPGTPHSAWSTATPMVFLSLHVQVSLSGGQDVLATLGVPHLQRVAPTGRLAGYLAGAAAEWDREPDDSMTALLMPAWTRLVTLQLLRTDADAGLLSPQTADPLVRAGLEAIRASVGRQVTPAALAAQVGVSQQHLNRVLRRTLGVTALQALTQLRMVRAATLLDQSGQTVRAIARQLGYDDPYHFSRVFTRHHGVSPAHWRRLHNGTDTSMSTTSIDPSLSSIPPQHER